MTHNVLTKKNNSRTGPNLNGTKEEAEGIIIKISSPIRILKSINFFIESKSLQKLR